MNESLTFPKYQTLCIPTGWAITGNKFFDIEPKEGILVDEAPNFGWSLFEEELLFCEYKKGNIVIDMGWFPNYDPNGNFILRVIKDNDWANRQRLCETQNKAEIVEAVYQAMFKISRDNGEYVAEIKSAPLQPLRVYNSGWRFVRNDFFDFDPCNDIKAKNLPSEDYWQLFHENMLHLEWLDDAKKQIRVGWFPAYDPNGRFNIVATTAKYFEPPLVDYSTRDKIEVVEIVEHLMKEIHKVKPNQK